MSRRVCKNGHIFEKTSDCPVCPKCSSEEMSTIFAQDFPNIGAPAFRALHAKGIKNLADLTKYSEKELLGLHGFGPRALRLLKDSLHKKELSLRAE